MKYLISASVGFCLQLRRSENFASLSQEVNLAGDCDCDLDSD